MHRLLLLAAVAAVGACAAPLKGASPPPPPIAGTRELPIGGDRADAFARYVTAMHRNIHRTFTGGFLDEINRRAEPAFASRALSTVVRIAVRADGSLARAGTLVTSPVAAFDAAAVASVRSAAPFSPTPPELRSVDGNVWVDWTFHRDERGCDPAGAEPHLLANDQPTASEKALE